MNAWIADHCIDPALVPGVLFATVPIRAAHPELKDLPVSLLAAWGLNLEFGVAGVVNFAYIVLVAAGAYFYAVFTLGPPAAMGGFQQYIIGA